MPLYDVEYVTPLTDQAQEELAKALTRIHADRFGTPSYFVNVRYVDVSSQKVFRGGIARRYNRIIFRCRAGETRSVALYNEHCASIVEAWGRIIEANFFRPQVGEEKSWLRQHAHEFQELAEAGDEDMKGLRDELRMRADFADVLNHQQGKRG
ncbi:MAG: hypothetical protein M1822_005818 [Bathelium mastoideum]|nr:MAG: hypothetical protein M1822_005818 [Bathelium mastoideum]